MSWWGKLIGGYLGFVLGGPIGALLGAAIGHNFDKPTDKFANFPGADHQRAQAAFFTVTFSVMGHLCKADGRVCENEIEIARRIMSKMQLNEAQKATAIHLFNQGKDNEFPLEEVLSQLKSELGNSKNILRVFIEIQCSAAFADALMHPDEKKLLIKIADIIGFSRYELGSIVAAIEAGFHHGNTRETGQGSKLSIKDARKILGVTAKSNQAEIKRAYRRLMSQHHPDKLIAKGLPEEMMKIATQRAQEIGEAYDRLLEK